MPAKVINPNNYREQQNRALSISEELTMQFTEHDHDTAFFFNFQENTKRLTAFALTEFKS